MAAGNRNGFCVGHGRPIYNHFCICCHLVHRSGLVDAGFAIQTRPMFYQKSCFSGWYFKLFLDILSTWLHSWNLQMLANSSKYLIFSIPTYLGLSILRNMGSSMKILLPLTRMWPKIPHMPHVCTVCPFFIWWLEWNQWYSHSRPPI